MNFLRPLLLILLTIDGCCSVSFAQLPANDANKYQMIVVNSADATPSSWFNESHDLAKLKAATAFTVLRPKANPQAKDGLFEARYRAVLGSDFPIVAYLRPDGGVIYFADRHSMPSRDRLYSEIKEAHLKAKDAAKAIVKPQAEFTESDWQEDCPDGNCPAPYVPFGEPNAPRFRPFKNPLDGDSQSKPFDRVLTGWFSDSVNSGIFLVSSVVCLMVIVLFAVLIFGAMIVVVRWVVK